MRHPNVALLVEDDQALLDLFTYALGAAPFGVVAANSYVAGLAALATRQPFCAVIADQTLGDGTGTDLLEWARARWPDASRVLMTGHPIALDGARVLRKPFGLIEFEQVVTDACERGCTASGRHFPGASAEDTRSNEFDLVAP